MTKKSFKKHTKVKHRKHQASSVIYIRYISFALVAIALILAGKGVLSATSRLHVLGTSTGPVLLADHGGDDSGGSGSGDSQQSISNNTQVDCVGPDGNHFTTDFKDCSDLNNAWHHSNFSFTPLSTPQQPIKQENNGNPQPTGSENEVKQEAVQQKPNLGESNKFEVKTEDGKTRIDLVQNGVKVRIEQEGDKIKVTAEKPDGLEVELDTKDSLDSINKDLETEGVEVATTDAHTIAIKKSGIEAETELPISVDPITHELTVTTPAGTKSVTVLPDEAVNNLLQNRVFTNVESQISSQSGTPTQNITLTQVNNEPTFEVQGVSQKKILGIFPVGFAKTAFVSAETGNIIKTDETLLNRLLEAISF